MANSFVRKIVVNNWGLKLLAFILAMISFGMIRSQTNEKASFDIPVEVHTEPGIGIHSLDTMSVHVSVQGSHEDILQLAKDRMKVTIRPRASGPTGSERVPIHPRNIEGISGVRVINIEPDSVGLSFDKEITRVVTVAEPRVTGEPAVGKVEIDYQPKAVRIRGPKSRLDDDRFVRVETEPVDVSGRVASFSERVRVIPPRDWVSYVEPEEISVRINIITQEEFKPIGKVRVLAIQEPGAIREVDFDPPTVDLRIRGRAELLEQVSKDSVKVFVNCVGLETSGSYELPVKIHIPAGLGVTAVVEPQTVKVSFGGE